MLSSINTMYSSETDLSVLINTELALRMLPYFNGLAWLSVQEDVIQSATVTGSRYSRPFIRPSVCDVLQKWPERKWM